MAEEDEVYQFATVIWAKLLVLIFPLKRTEHIGSLNAEVREPWNLSKVHNVHNDTVQ